MLEFPIKDQTIPTEWLELPHFSIQWHVSIQKTGKLNLIKYYFYMSVCPGLPLPLKSQSPFDNILQEPQKIAGGGGGGGGGGAGRGGGSYQTLNSTVM